MPMSLRTEAFRDNPRKLAILYGPLVLCARCRAGKSAPRDCRGAGADRFQHPTRSKGSR